MSGGLRQDVVSGSWTVVAPRRGERPLSGSSGPVALPADGPERDPECPFCPGNEGELPAVIDEVPAPGGGWAARVVPNRYPAFTDLDVDPGEPSDGRRLPLPTDGPIVPEPVLEATGRQEVVVEGPVHSADLSKMTAEQVECIVRVWRDRLRQAEERVGREGRVVLFRNRGRAAGSSILHPHTQLIRVRHVPPEMRRREIRMLSHHRERSRCLLCALPEMEPGWDRRVVSADGRFTAVVPWAPATSRHVRLIPREHQASFARLDEASVTSLAAVLGRVLARLRERAGDPPYNLTVHSWGGSGPPEEALHWYLEIRPRDSQPAGFELAAGVSIAASDPEEDARLLATDESER